MPIEIVKPVSIAKEEYRILKFTVDLSGTPGIIDLTVRKRQLDANGVVVTEESMSHSIPETRFTKMPGFAQTYEGIKNFLYADFQEHRLNQG